MALLLIGVACSGDAPVQALTGQVTWSVDHADAADCTYTRHYTGHEDASAPWRCRSCEAIYRVEATLEGADCHASVSGDEPSPVEWLGRGDGVFYRVGAGNWPLVDQGRSTVTEGGFTTQHGADGEAPGGTPFAFDITGTFEETLTEDLDPLWGMVPPRRYACGWPSSNPPPYEGDYTVAEGEVLPDGVFLDACDEPVRLWDLLDRYLVVSVGAADCGPCQVMARTERDFEAELAEAGAETRVVTLMAPSLSDPATSAEPSLLREWTETFDVDGPVLADRGYGFTVIGEAVPDFAFPTTAVVAPDGEVLALQVGFGDWTPFRETILAHAGSTR